MTLGRKKPRPFLRTKERAILPILFDLYKRPSAVRLMAISTPPLLIGIACAALALRSLPIVSAVLITGGAGYFCQPAYVALRAWWHLRSGRRGTARVTELMPQSGQFIVSLEGAKYGWTEGLREVATNGEFFDDRFATDAPWALHITVGTELAVVVHPSRPKVVLELGLTQNDLSPD